MNDVRLILPIRSFLAGLCILCVACTAYGQAVEDIAQPPAYHGGNPNIYLDLRDPAKSSRQISPQYDYTKFNPGYRKALPLKRTCSTMEVEEDRRALHRTESLDDFENWLQKSVVWEKGMTSKAFTQHTLPVVIHVIYSNPQENISDSQVRSQIQVLNADYQRTNPDTVDTPGNFEPVATGTGIRFALASADPIGNPTNGIDRISVSGAPFTEKYVNEIIKPNTIWDPQRYLNIWVCNLAAGVLGFAQFPSSSGLTGIPDDPGAAETDGVVIHYLAFGTEGTAVAPFNLGRTTTHEMGHWLGLRHIWGDGDCEKDDFCQDTPPADFPHFGCPAGITACTGPGMIQNFMDYTDDACMNLFTLDQARRIRTVLENSPRRKELLFSRASAGSRNPPLPDFRSDIQAGCGPLTVLFRDVSTGNPVSWNWSFPGGTPYVSRDPNPVVTYEWPGAYPVTLTVTNANGSRTKVLQDYITVTGQGLELPLSSDLESDIFPPEGFTLVDRQPGFGWEQNDRSGGHGKSAGSIWFNNYENNLRGTKDWFLSPVLDFSGGLRSSLSFDLAYAGFDEKYQDTLGIFISTGCSSRFQAIYYKGGAKLQTAGNMVRPFFPDPGEWRTEKIDLSAFDGEAFVQIAFVNLSGYGNNIFLDNIRIESRPIPQPEPEFFAEIREICAGEAVSLNDLSHFGNHRSWSFPGGFPGTDTVANPVVSYPEPGAYDVILTISNATGNRTIVKEAYIFVKPAPDLRLEASSTRLCPGEQALLQASGALRYRWIPADHLDRQAGQQVLATPPSSTTYMVSGEGPNGCIAVEAVTLRVSEISSIRFQPPSASFCEGASVMLTASGAESIQWSPATGLSNTNGQVVQARPAETTVYTAQGLSADGCKVEGKLTVRVGTAPEVSISATGTDLCPGDRVMLQASGAGSYSWAAADGLERREGASIPASPMKTTTYKVWGTNESGCKSEASLTLRVGKKPGLQLDSPPAQVCEGATASLQASGGTAYRWKGPGILSDPEEPSILIQPDAPATYTLIGTSPEGCLDSLTTKIDLLRPAPVLINPSHPVLCPGQRVQLRVDGLRNPVWTPQTGLSVAGTNVTASPAEPTTYTVRGIDRQGCEAKGTVKVDLAASLPPKASFSAEETRICAGELIRFRNGSQNGTTLLWSFPGGDPAFSGDPDPEIRYSKAGIYDVYLTVNGCAGNDSLVRKGFIVVSNPIAASIRPEETTVCKGTPVWIYADGGTAIEWSPASAITRVQPSGALLNPKENTVISAKIRDLNGCETLVSTEIKVKGGSGKVQLSPEIATVCLGESLELTASGTPEVAWMGPEEVAGSHGMRIRIKPEAEGKYIVKGLDMEGCESYDTAWIDVRKLPEVIASPNEVQICPGGIATLSATGAESYTWSPSVGLNAATGQEVEAFPDQTTIYTVSGTDRYGCSGEAVIPVKVRGAARISIKADKTTLCKGEGVRLQADGADNLTWYPPAGLSATDGKVVFATPTVTTTYMASQKDAPGCDNPARITIEVLQPEPLIIKPASVTLCKGEEVQLMVSGGKNYAWKPTEGVLGKFGDAILVKPAATTTYSVTGFDSQGCRNTATATLIVREPSEITLASSSRHICEGEGIVLKASGAENYEWLDGTEGLNASGETLKLVPIGIESTFRVAGRDASGCRDTATLRVQISPFEAAFTLSDETVDLARKKGIVRFMDRTEGAIRWEWHFGDGGIALEKDPVHIYTRPGLYPVTLTVSNGLCEATEEKWVRVENGTDLHSILDAGGFSLRRSEAQNSRFSLEFPVPGPLFLQLRLLNSTGTVILTDKLTASSGTESWSFDLSTYPPGVYHLQISDGIETETLRVENR